MKLREWARRNWDYAAFAALLVVALVAMWATRNKPPSQLRVEMTAHAQKPMDGPYLTGNADPQKPAEQPLATKIDWTPCQKAIEPFKERVEQFNRADRIGLRIELHCTYSGNPDYMEKPEQRVALTLSEKRQLRTLQKSWTAAFRAESEYEKQLLNAHHLHKPEPGDRCPHFVGIKLGDDYITIDPNSFDPECRTLDKESQ